MYNHDLKEIGSKLATAQSLPQNTNAYGDEGSKEFHKTLGAVQVKVTCNEAISIAATKKLEIEMYDSADDSTFAVVPGTKVTITDSTPSTYAADDVLARIGLPSSLRRYCKIRFLTDDASASGKVDAWLDFLPH